MTSATIEHACPACHAPLSPGARFCHRCGRAAAAGSERERRAWMVAWVAVAVFMALIIYYVNREPAQPAGPDMANAGNSSGGAAAAPGAPPDISQMSPEERFLRLHDRVMAADEGGDTATVARFAPMALAAYGMLDTRTVDLRYHAGALYLRVGGYGEALALADTIQAESKDNLLADLLRIETAQARSDRSAAQAATRAFLSHYDAQLALNRPEYQEHRAMLEDLKRQLER